MLSPQNKTNLVETTFGLWPAAGGKLLYFFFGTANLAPAILCSALVTFPPYFKSVTMFLRK